MLGFLKQTEKDFERFCGRDTSPFSRLRGKSFERFLSLGLPSTDQEEWKYTSLEPLSHTSFAIPEEKRSAQVLLPRESGGARVLSITQALKDFPELVTPHFGHVAGEEKHPFVALNTALFQEGTFVYLPAGTILKEPIQLIFRTGETREIKPDGENRPVFHPRYLIFFGKGSQASVIESYQGSGSGAYLTNAVTELVLEEGSLIEHLRLQEEGEEACHLADLSAHVGRSASLHSHLFSFGSGLARNEIRAVLGDEGAECALNGLYIASNRQHFDNQTTIDHARPHGTSTELYKGILADRSTAVFNGCIRVRPEAQKTNARQVNKNLILSDEAVVNTKPLLEIFANDVKCNHGATIGRLDEKQVFYLRSRGLSDLEARGLLTFAFASELLGRLKFPAAKKHLQDILLKKMMQGTCVLPWEGLL